MSDIEAILAKCDVVLDLNDPDFSSKLREAIGLKDGEECEFVTPQFDRTDGRTVPIPLIDFGNLFTLCEETLREIGCQKWSEPDENGEVLWLYPGEWYDHIPDGTTIVDIGGNRELFKRGETDDDRRYGALAYGFMRAAEAL